MNNKMRSKISIWLFFHICAIFGFMIGANADVHKNEPQICKSLEITTLKGFEALRHCKVIVGHVRIVNIQLTPTTAVPASIVEEITDYLLVYRVHGLSSLQHVFPRLKLIRGHDLLFNKYSLVVLENRELENLGLISLLRIQKGNVRIENNPVLCFVDTVNWVYLLGNNTLQDISFKNKPSHQCPLCNETFADIDVASDDNLRKHCWNLDAYQRNTIYGTLNCTKDCGIYGCNANGDCCSPRCLTGCSDQDCELCANLNHTSGCRDICPLFYFEFNKRECVNHSSCLSRSLIPYSGVCLESCPQHYVEANNTCGNPCTGDYVIHDSKDIAALVDCQFIRGSLVIELREIKTKIVNELENALSNVKEITKYLKVKNSPQLISLQFLRSLHTIKGEELIDGKYALYVVNNYHLEHIWNQNVAIFKGRIFFHLNPRLCYDQILKLTSSVKSVQKLEISDVSMNSNGERVVCGKHVRLLNATVEDLNATAVRIRVNPMSSEDITQLIGYAHFYKEAPIKNVSWYDGRHGCGHDDWMMDISPYPYIRHVIRNLKPFTQYAYFVKTITMTDYHMQLHAYSKIQYFRTLPCKPGPVKKVYYHSLSPSEIMIHWWPPLSPNGNIAYYLVNFTKSKDNSSSDTTTNYLLDPASEKPKDICKCQMKLPFYSGPLPSDENYYSKEQITYEEAFSNFIYVPRVASIPEQNEDSAENINTNETETVHPRNTSENNITQTTNNTATTNNTVTTNNTATANNTTNSESKVNMNATIATNTTEGEYDEEELCFKKLRLEQEQKAFDLQNTNLTEFQIDKPKPICPTGNITSTCRVIKHFEGIHVPGYIHHYIINKLDPEITYNISVRACLESGECGAQKIVFAKTISKALETFINSAQDLSKDIDE